MWRIQNVLVREALAVSLSVFAQIVIVYLFLQTHSLYKADYIAGCVLVPVFANLVVQARFPYAATATLISSLIFFIAILIVKAMPLPVKLTQTTVTFSLDALTLIANFQLERQMRRHYLLTLREQLRNDELTTNNRNLQVLSERDPLTGAYNRRALDDRIAPLLAASKRDARSFGAIMVDVDHFKSFNDGFGHLAGDRCLQRVAAILIEETRNSGDLVARYGGEEFVVIISDAGNLPAPAIAERLRARIAAEAIPRPQDDRTAPSNVVTASFGTATCHHTGFGTAQHCPCTPEDLLRRSDEALYSAKQSGRNRVCQA